MREQEEQEEQTGSALAWSVGTDRALAMVAMGMQAANGSLLRMGVDRLIARAEMSEELAPAMPMLAAEAAQDGVLRCWDAMIKSDRSKGLPDFGGRTADLATNVALMSIQPDDWSQMFAEEMVRVAARAATRSAPMVKSISRLVLSDCLPAASSFFFALMAHDRLFRIERPSPDVTAEVGTMLAAYEASEGNPGIWRQCRELAELLVDPLDPSSRWPASVKCSAPSLLAALAEAGAAGEEATPPSSPSSSGSGRSRLRG